MHYYLPPEGNSRWDRPADMIKDLDTLRNVVLLKPYLKRRLLIQ